jgi:hypothetical protein
MHSLASTHRLQKEWHCTQPQQAIRHPCFQSSQAFGQFLRVIG